VVQTVILANGINLSSDPESAEKYRHVISASGVIGLMDDVLWASERIPDTPAPMKPRMNFAVLCSPICGTAKNARVKPLWPRRVGSRAADRAESQGWGPYKKK
jgi:hypothetical protein